MSFKTHERAGMILKNFEQLLWREDDGVYVRKVFDEFDTLETAWFLWLYERTTSKPFHWNKMCSSWWARHFTMNRDNVCPLERKWWERIGIRGWLIRYQWTLTWDGLWDALCEQTSSYSKCNGTEFRQCVIWLQEQRFDRRLELYSVFWFCWLEVGSWR